MLLLLFVYIVNYFLVRVVTGIFCTANLYYYLSLKTFKYDSVTREGPVPVSSFRSSISAMHSSMRGHSVLLKGS